jgi:Glucose-6-P dehydrogenase subunit
VIVDLPDTTVSKVSKKLSKLRQEGGVVALGRVLTLVIQTDFRRIEEVVEAANASSRTHPARVIVVADEVDVPGEARLDAQIRVGGDAGASEVVILRAYGGLAQSLNGLVGGLLLPDAPIVVWWPNSCPDAPAESDLGQIATRRITDSANQADPQDYLKQLANNYHPGDGDMAWTRLTLWRSQLASLFDRVSDKKIEKVEIIGSELSPSADLLAAWFRVKLGGTHKHL